MSGKSAEFTGELFTKSESRTEDVIAMMDEVQDKFIHKFRDMDGEVQCYEKKVISGDNKTEKNSYYGILRYDKDNSYITTQISFHSSKLDETTRGTTFMDLWQLL